MINNSIIFFLVYYIYFGISLFLISLKLKKTEIIFKAKHKDMILNRILKKEFNKNLNNFLNIIQKLLNKKKMINLLKLGIPLLLELCTYIHFSLKIEKL